MITLLKIGYDYYAMPNAKAAATAINALAGCIKLRRDFGNKTGDFFYPDEHQDEIGMVVVRDNQVLRGKPADDVEAPRKPRQLPERT
jgi:hypothetical protein